MTKEEQNLLCDKLNAARELESRVHRIEEILSGIGNSSFLIISNGGTKEVVARLGEIVPDDGVDWLKEGLQLVADRIQKEYDAL
jgi:hypothetical protein